MKDMSRYKLDRILCIDTEWTCWDGPPPDGMASEIIEIGIVEADIETLSILREGRYLVRPERSTVSPYCTALTGLTQREVHRQGRALGDTLRSLAKAFGPASKLTIAWGDDWSGIERECGLAGIPNPFPPGHAVDIGKAYAIQSGSTRRPGLETALERMGLGFEGEPHRAVTDARNTVRAYAGMSRALRAAFPEPEPAGPRPG